MARLKHIFMRNLLLVLAIPAVIGCSQELGRERLATAHVKGTVKLMSRPLSVGWIEFWPVQGTLGNFRVAPLKPDGSFELSGVAVGRNRIVLAHAPLGDIFTPIGTVPGQMFTHLSDSPIEREIKLEGNTLDLDLGPIAYEYALKKRRGG